MKPTDKTKEYPWFVNACRYVVVACITSLALATLDSVWVYQKAGYHFPVCARDAHVHIELAAWKMVRRHVVELDESVDIDNLTGDTNIYSACCTKDIYTLLGSGPTDADALLAAVRGINAKENA